MCEYCEPHSSEYLIETPDYFIWIENEGLYCEIPSMAEYIREPVKYCPKCGDKLGE